MSWLDAKYVSLLSGRLQKFKRKSPVLYNFRCPLCGDSSKNRNKARAYFFQRDGAFWFHCHNCLSGNTTILTKEYGIVEIKDVLGKEIYVKVIDNEWCLAKVKSYGNQKLYQYSFKTYNSSKKIETVVATENHRWFIENRGKKGGREKERPYFVTDNLMVGDILFKQSSNFIPSNLKNRGIIHGLIFGDGTLAQKKYAIIRICKKDKVRDEIIKILHANNILVSFPPNLKGDGFAHIGPFPYMKELPSTNDPEYIAGFIYGWWLADGYKPNKGIKTSIQISTISESAAKWLEKNAVYIGYRHSSTFIAPAGRRGAFANGKPLYNVLLTNATVKVISKDYYGEEEVFCLEEPITHSFVLGNGLLTGNCSVSLPFYRFLKDFDSGLYGEYRFESLGDKHQILALPQHHKLVTSQVIDALDKIECIDGLHSSHKAKQFLVKRKIPKQFFEELYYCPDFKTWTNIQLPDKISGKYIEEERIIIPLFDSLGKMFGYQGRALEVTEERMRYIGVMLDETKPKIWGLNHADFNRTYYVTEGAFDAMFLPNALATMGGKITSELYRVGCNLDNAVVLYDNEPRNSQVVANVRSAINNNFRVIIWPSWWKYKDINEAILDGVNDLPNIIQKSTFKGLQAELEFNRWRKV